MLYIILFLVALLVGLTLHFMPRGALAEMAGPRTRTFVCSSCGKTVTEDAASHSGSQCSDCFDDHFSRDSERAWKDED